jgi:hypothetical protein
MLGRRSRALVVAVGMAAAIVGVMIASVASASSRLRSQEPPVVRPHFRHVGEAVYAPGPVPGSLTFYGSFAALPPRSRALPRTPLGHANPHPAKRRR